VSRCSKTYFINDFNNFIPIYQRHTDYSSKIYHITFLCISAQTFQIRKEFINGNIKFSWTNTSIYSDDILVTKDEHLSDWIRTTDDEYTVWDVLQYKSVKIKVRVYTPPEFKSRKDYDSTYLGKLGYKQQVKGTSNGEIGRVLKETTVGVQGWAYLFIRTSDKSEGTVVSGATEEYADWLHQL
jgi:hypothetical protein